MTRKPRKLLAVLALLGPGPAAAHSFGQLPTLPVPFWLYAWGAAATLVASFVVASLVPAGHRAASAPAEARWHVVPRGALRVLRGGALAALLLCIATGLAGTSGVYANFNMTCFWVVFGLGYVWLTALIGDWYGLIGAWPTLAAGLDRLPALARWRRPYPERFGYGPAIVLYGAWVALELFGHATPKSLALALLGYTGITLAGAARYGARDWLRFGEIFVVLTGLLARLAPVEVEDRDGGARWRWRRPLSGLRVPADGPPGLVLFGVFLLSATAFDGLHEARPWVNLFWHRVYPLALEPAGYSIYTGASAVMQVYRGWQLAWLLASPLLYLAAYRVALALMRRLTPARETPRELALAFFPSLLPIAFAYHVTHYYTLLLGQGPRIVPLLSDPFGWGWNLFGTAQWLRGSYVPDAMAVWHVQVALILAGHVAGVAVAHREALRRFGGRRAALLSQLPLLALMVAFTVGGLWILSLPFDPGPVRYGG